MSPRVRHWLAIFVCVAIPATVLVLAARADTPLEPVDPLRPARCQTLIDQARVDAGAAEKRAGELVADPDATEEERHCGLTMALLLAMFDAQDGESRLVTAPVAPGCVAAAGLARVGDLDGARAAYREVLNATSIPSVAKSCAVGGLSRLPASASPADWTFDQANAALAEVSGWLLDEPLQFPSGMQTWVVSISWLLTVGLLLVALRQFIRWRRERVPGPVEVKPVDVVPGKTETIKVAEIMRETLMKAGVYPSSKGSGVGEISIDVGDILGVAGETGRVGKLVEAVRRAVEINTGYVLVVAGGVHDADSDGPCKLTVQLDSVTGGTVGLETFEGDDFAELAELAAYHVYLWLADTAPVRRRTPWFLRWNRASSLAKYHEAIGCMRRNASGRAVELLDEVVPAEPANLLVQLSLSRAHHRLAMGTVEDRALRSTDQQVGEHYLRSLVAATRAVLLNTDSEEAHARLAIMLGLVEAWYPWWVAQPQLREEALEGLRAVDRRAAELDDEVGAHPSKNRSEFVGYFKGRAKRHWDKALRRSWWYSVNRIAFTLDRRRTVAGQIWLFRRRRKSIQDLVIGAWTATTYDVMSEAASRRARARAYCRLLSVRFGYARGLRRESEREPDVRYNLAAACARRAVWLQRRSSASPDRGRARGRRRSSEERAVRLALRYLNHWCSGRGGVLTEAQLQYLDVDPDFADLAARPEYLAWRRRFADADDAAIANRAWQDTYDQLSNAAVHAATAASELSLDRPPVGATWTEAHDAFCKRFIEAVQADRRRWALLDVWLANAASVSARDAFVEACPASGALGADALADLPAVDCRAGAVRADLAAAWQELGDAVAALVPIPPRSADQLIVLARLRDRRAQDSLVAAWSERTARRWTEVARWSRCPTGSAPQPLPT